MWQLNVDDCPKEQYQHHKSPYNHESMNILAEKSIAELIQYAHYEFGSPPVSRKEKAIKARFLINVPGMTLERFRQHRPHSVLTALGHQDRQRHNKKHKQDTTTYLDNCFFPTGINQRTHECFLTAVS
jgi:hypothetical protein